MRPEYVIAALLLAFASVPAWAKSLYVERVEQATPDAKALADARQQIERHKDIKPRDLPLRPYHTQAPLPETAYVPFCAHCHGELPHRSEERSRSFLNMHTRYVACETCHLRPRDAQLEYRWLAYDGPNAGREVQPRSPSKDPRAALAPKVGAKIAPFHQGNRVPVLRTSGRIAQQQQTNTSLPLQGEGQDGDGSAVTVPEKTFITTIERTWKTTDITRKADLKARLHTPLAKQGPACKDCHGPHSMLDLAALGASPAKARAIANNPVAQFFARYRSKDERLRLTDVLR